jgi:hypothetical protein
MLGHHNTVYYPLHHTNLFVLCRVIIIALLILYTCRVPKCRGHGGQRLRKRYHDLRKILSKMCKKCNFGLFAQRLSFE